MQALKVCAGFLSASLAFAQGIGFTSDKVSFALSNLTKLTGNGGQVDWSPSNVIAFDRINPDANPNGSRYWGLFTMNPDGSNQFCVTCTPAALASLPTPQYPSTVLNAGNGAWSKTSSFIIFQMEQQYGGSPTIDALHSPPTGWNMDLWWAKPDGSAFGPLYTTSTSTGGTIHPTFSLDGSHLVFGCRYAITPAPYGSWKMCYAPYSESNGTPTLGQVQEFEPGENAGYYEPRGISINNNLIFAMSNTGCAGPAKLGDIYSLNLETRAWTNLTNLCGPSNEFPTPHPTLPFLIFMSSRSWPDSGYPKTGHCELWKMDYDGNNLQRLTWVTDPDFSDYNTAGVCLVDPEFSPDGSQIVFGDNQGRGPAIPGAISRADLTIAGYEPETSDSNKIMGARIGLRDLSTEK